MLLCSIINCVFIPPSSIMGRPTEPGFSLTQKSAVPQWYLAMEDGQILGGLGVIENDFHAVSCSHSAIALPSIIPCVMCSPRRIHAVVLVHPRTAKIRKFLPKWRKNICCAAIHTG